VSSGGVSEWACLCMFFEKGLRSFIEDLEASKNEKEKKEKKMIIYVVEKVLVYDLFSSYNFDK
jgi:hypothetical protein